MNTKSKAIIVILALTNIVLLLMIVLGPKSDSEIQKQLDKVLAEAERNAGELRKQELRAESAIRIAGEKETIISRLRVELTECQNQ